jgi:hypothetical protein
LWGSGATRVGGVIKYFLRSLKAFCLVHWIFSYFLWSLKKGGLPTPSLEMNHLKADMHPINFCMSWWLLGGIMFVVADTFSRLGSIPCWEITYPSNFHDGTLNVHSSGFNFMLNFLRFLKVSARSKMSPSSSQVLTTTSSMYASTLRPS